MQKRKKKQKIHTGYPIGTSFYVRKEQRALFQDSGIMSWDESDTEVERKMLDSDVAFLVSKEKVGDEVMHGIFLSHSEVFVYLNKEEMKKACIPLSLGKPDFDINNIPVVGKKQYDSDVIKQIEAILEKSPTIAPEKHFSFSV